MDVQPGEIVHMDENGACKFPADKIEAVLANVKVLLKDEAIRLTALRQAKTAAEVRAAFSGAAYSDPKAARRSADAALPRERRRGALCLASADQRAGLSAFWAGLPREGGQDHGSQGAGRDHRDR